MTQEIHARDGKIMHLGCMGTLLILDAENHENA